MRTNRFDNNQGRRRGAMIEIVPARGNAIDNAIAEFQRRRDRAMPGRDAARVGQVTAQRAQLAPNQTGNRGRKGSQYMNVFLPGCKIPTGYHPDRMAAPSEECQKAAIQHGGVLCVTQAGGESLAVTAAALLAGVDVVVTPQDSQQYWAMELQVSVYDQNAQTRVFNGTVDSAVTTGRNQFVGINTPLSMFADTMPYLGVTWDRATPSTPYRVRVRGIAAGNVDIRVGTSGYALR